MSNKEETVELTQNKNQYLEELGKVYQEISQKIKTTTHENTLTDYLNQKLNLLRGRFSHLANELQGHPELITNAMINALAIYQNMALQQQKTQKQQIQMQQQLNSDWFNISQGIAMKNAQARDNAWAKWFNK
ncbi:hypothetical protein AV545_18535 [Paenibacillus jamilae]|uniref:hypothetical protein n=1 Tax=Paenibacillus jamilae TaxID=114136 RepID=UPI0007AB8535|nr:hypothetical protein [Paenibacillus jamilae]KZE71204.1 hypothetical protein AV545_18535 [Paenibacillus jamilae]